MPRSCGIPVTNMGVWLTFLSLTGDQGRHRLHANVARFQRSSLKNSRGSTVKWEVDNNPVMVLDESCLNMQDYSCCLMGKEKEFDSLSNLKVVLGSEGFDITDIRYLGGFSMMIEFLSKEVQKKFLANKGIGTWFSPLKQASTEFNIDGRVTWVEIESIPLKVWSENTFKCIASKWGVLLDVDDPKEKCFRRKRVRAKEVPGWVPDFAEHKNEDSESEDENLDGHPIGDNFVIDKDLEGDDETNEVPETVLEEALSKSQGREDSVRQNEMQSEDPIGIKSFLMLFGSYYY
ncbi:nucleotide-binding alpha-beta plait domain-containing protein [Tanacetum coccineum]